MLLQLDPQVPLVWRTPTSLQFGVDLPRLVLDHVSLIDEVMLAALRTGTGPSHLHDLVARAGGAPDHVTALLAELESVLLGADTLETPTLPALQAASVLIDGDGETAALLNHALQREGFAVEQAHGAAVDLVPTPPDLVVIVANYAVQPRRYGRWLRTDVPHLPIVFGDGGVRIGPLVQPGTGPCLFCLDLEHTDRDAAWPAVASQLTGQTARTETPHSARMAAGMVGGLITERLRPARGSELADRWSTTSVHIAHDGWVSHAEHHPHPQCGCQLG